MARSYTAFTTLITRKLQSAGTVDWSVAEVDDQIEECLKEISHYNGFKHLVPVLFKIESRYGTASSTSADNLVDTTKGQFLSADATEEKVVENRTDHNRAVVLSFSSTAQIGISRDIFAVNENYRVYNKRCWNKKQIFIGDLTDWLAPDSVEYPIGEKRNWKIYGNEILELNIDGGKINDSNAGSTITELPDVDVLVRFNRPHVLSQLTDWSALAAATAAAGATTLSASALQSAGTIEIGEEFFIENHKSAYIVMAETTISANTAVITFYPGLEAKVSATTWAITFVKSSLLSEQEDIFADLVASRLAINKAPKYFNTIAIGGGIVWQNYQAWGERRLAMTLRKLESQSPPKVRKSYPRE